MSAAHHSRTDLEEAERVGRAAAELALAGQSGLMITLVRESDRPYRCATGATPLERVANRQRLLPDEFIAPGGQGLTAAFERYARPLLGDPLPTYARLV
jgi:6-phosphofructokinase 1